MPSDRRLPRRTRGGVSSRAIFANTSLLPPHAREQSLMSNTSFYRRHGKRWFDLAISIPLIILLAPLIGTLAVLIRWKLGSPVLFTQIRPGLNGHPFRMVKFRSMTDARNDQGELLPDDIRLTRWGQFLRNSSLDELPELWNVLRGEMSLVGPRPLLTSYLDLYTPSQARRHEVVPGITGWAQVNGRNSISWDQKFTFDVEYVDRVNIFLDLRILILTVLRVIQKKNISAQGHATMPIFLGTPHNHDPSSQENSP